MGSVQVFPRQHPRPTPAPEWRRKKGAGGGLVRVRECRLEDYGAVRALHRRAAPHAAPWSLKQFESRRVAFAEGQLIAESDGEVLGHASALIVAWNEFGLEHTLKQITAEGFLTTHEPCGDTLYGAEIFVDETEGGTAVSRALMDARRKLCRRTNLARIITTARLAGYRERRETMTPEAYAMRVVWGDIAEPGLRYLLAHGFQYCGVSHGFQPEDAAACGHAALLAWLNPLYSPRGPRAFIQSDRPRKCA